MWGRSRAPKDNDKMEPGAHVFVSGERESDWSKIRVVHVKQDKTTKGEYYRSRNPHREQIDDRPHGKGTKRYSLHSDPVTLLMVERGLGGPSSLGEKKAWRIKTPSSMKTRTCSECNKVCRNPGRLTKH